MSEQQNQQKYTHGHAESVLRSHRWRTAANSAGYLLDELQPGMSLLDVGAGPGTITAELADLLAPGEVTALEISPAAAEVTRSGLGSRPVEVIVGDVHALDLPDDQFDVVHAHQVLQHVADPVTALRELARVTKPGGLIAVRDSDYSAFAWWPRLPELDTWMSLYQRAARANGGEPDAGRRLLSWAHAAGLSEVVPSSTSWCLATREDRAWWGGMWADRILTSDLTEQLRSSGWADQATLQAISDAWRTWAQDEDGWLTVPSGELLIRV
ncbi:class I SAM-dependent methyltransferase [Dermacoccaceae bacterium W4C1]